MGQLLLQLQGNEADQSDPFGKTPLAMAFHQGWSEGVHLFSQLPSEVNQMIDSESLLLLVAHDGNLQLVKELMSRPDIDMYARGEHNNTR